MRTVSKRSAKQQNLLEFDQLDAANPDSVEAIPVVGSFRLREGDQGAIPGFEALPMHHVL